MGHEDDRDTRVRVAREGARLLHDHRERSGPPPGAADASWLALTRRIAAGEPGPLGDDEVEAEPGRSGAPSWRRWALGAVAVAAALALWQLAPGLAGRYDGTAGHAANLQQIEPGDPRSATSHGDGPRDRRAGPSGQVLRDMLQRTDEDVASDPPGARDEPAIVNDSAGSGPAAAVPADRRASDKAAGAGDSREPAGAAATRDADLARQLKSLRAAAEAVRAGQGAQALTQADDYLKTYPTGAFVPEARLHRAEALCLLGRAEDARAASDSFVRELPESPLRARIAAVCAR